MTRSTPARFRAFPAAFAFVAGASCWPAASFAQSTPAPVAAQSAPSAPDDTIRLTDEERWKILEGNTVESAAAARGELADSERPARGIHGEVGVMIGSHGTRGAYGTADIPLGENGSATVSVESSTFRYRR